MKILVLLTVLLWAVPAAHAFNWPVAVKIACDDQNELRVSVVFTEGAEEQFGYKSISGLSVDEAAGLLSKLGGGMDVFSIGILADRRSDSMRYRTLLRAIVDNVSARIACLDDGCSISLYRELVEQHEITSKTIAEPDSASIRKLALRMMPRHPIVCLGIESVPGLDDKIHGRESLSRASVDWKSLGKVAEEQTDYTVEVGKDRVLIRPKKSPEIHDGPIVDLPVTTTTAVSEWQTIGGALRQISFLDESREFAPYVVATSKTYLADQALRPAGDQVDELESHLTKPNSGGTAMLSDALFLIARMAGATVWNYQSYDGIVIEGKDVKLPRKLIHGNASFSGPPRQ